MLSRTKTVVDSGRKVFFVVLAMVFASISGMGASFGDRVSIHPSSPTALQIVSVQNFSFVPADVTITAGDTVRWNFGTGLHSSTSGTCCQPDNIWDSGIMGPGGVFEQTFTTPGVYPYFCYVHEQLMTGSVTVNMSTASGVSISGRVLDGNGRALKQARVQLTDDQGATRIVSSGKGGYFLFTEVPAGHTYQILALNRRYTYEPMLITVNDNVAGLDLVPAGKAFLTKERIIAMHEKICGPEAFEARNGGAGMRLTVLSE